MQEQINEAMTAGGEPVAELDDVNGLVPLVLEPHNGQVFLIANDGMPNEGPENTLSRNNDKYCTPHNEGFSMVWQFTTPFLMRGYVIKTANDCASRDPYEWNVTGQEVSGIEGEEVGHVQLDEQI